MVPDQKKIGERVKSFGMKAGISGVEVWEDEEITSRAVRPEVVS